MVVFDDLIGEILCSKGPTGTDGGPGAKGPVVCYTVHLTNFFITYYKHTRSSQITRLILYRVMLVHKVKAAILDPLAHQDLREALVSLVSKDNW